MVWNAILNVIRGASSLQLFKGKLRNASRSLDRIQLEKEACLISSKTPSLYIFKIFILCINISNVIIWPWLVADITGVLIG